LTFSTISNPTFPIQFPKGRNGTVTTKFTNPVGVQSYKVFMHPSPQHRYSEKSRDGIDYFVVRGSDINSKWSGVGSTGNVIDIKPKFLGPHSTVKFGDLG